MTDPDVWKAEALRVAGLTADYDQEYDHVDFSFRTAAPVSSEPTRRDVLQILGAGLLIAVAGDAARGQQRPGGNQQGGRGGGPFGRGATTIQARVHVGEDGVLTVMTGKVECGQGARAELSQAAAEELRVSLAKVRLVMADTGLVPNDGGTFGSMSTPGTVPAIRQGCAAARDLLRNLAAKRWSVEPGSITVADGRATTAGSDRSLAYADLARDADAAAGFAAAIPPRIALTPVAEWRIMGVATPRPNGRDIVVGGHAYPSDIVRPGMLYGKILRQPSYGAQLKKVDLAPARKMPGVVVVQDGGFIGVAAPTSAQARAALEAIEDTAEWEPGPHPSSAEVYDYLRTKTRNPVPANPFADDLAKAARSLRQTYHVAYIQHAPMETRAAVAEWADGGVTVWTGGQAPFNVRSELARAFGIDEAKARVIIPDFGGGFGGKHSGEAAVEAAKLAKEAGKPVRVAWTRAEEFTWAQFRPAAVIDAEAALNTQGELTSWHFLNLNSGASEVNTPYRAGKARGQYIACDPPLRHGSYRGLAATANTFARECFMDELARLADRDPLGFRLAHLDNDRLRAVLEAAAQRFDWPTRSKGKTADAGVGLACGVDKGSYVAACVALTVDRAKGKIHVEKITQAYECGKIINPSNLLSQVQGGILMGLGPALREAMDFQDGVMRNASFRDYAVPRFTDVPELDIHLLDRPDLPSAGAGETPLIAVAPAIANAVFAATGTRIRQMPILWPGTRVEKAPDA